MCWLPPRNQAGAGLRRRAVTHPYFLGGIQTSEQQPRAVGGEFRATIFRGSRLIDGTARGVRNYLMPVTDAENRDSELENRRVDRIGVFCVDRRRAT